MPLLPTFTPFNLLELSACVKEMDRIFAHNRNKYGDKGSPCLKPYDGVKDLVKFPFIN